MGKIKLSEFPLLETIRGSTTVPVVDSGSNYMITLSNILYLYLYPSVTIISLSGASTFVSTPLTDETIVITLTSGLASLNLRLPSSSNSRVGQLKTWVINNPSVTTTVDVVGGGSLMGNALTTAFQYEAYTYQCISTELSGKWLRLS